MAERYGYTDAWWPVVASRLDWIRNHNVKAIRIPVACPIPYEGYLADTIDPILYAIGGTGAKAYLVFNGWGGGPDAGMSAYTYGEHCFKYAVRYGPRIVYCLWNEPNLCPAGSGPRSLYPAEAVAYVSTAAQYIKYAASDATILGSPMSPTNAHSATPWREYLRIMYTDTPKYVDVAMHLYPNNGDTSKRLASIKEQFRLGKYLGRPVHVTELDMAAPWIFPGAGAIPQLSAKAYDLLDAEGARSIIYFSIDNHLPEAKAIKAAAAT